jgi:DNA-binding CsgD family transcriptional regulator
MTERGAVLGAVERLLEQARGGRGGALFVVGAAGLGKTALLEHAFHHQTLSGPRAALAWANRAAELATARGGETARARMLLAEALHIAEECGAGWHANRARTQWRRAGGRTRTRKPDELSPPEVAVAQLAKAGRTNREIAHQLHLSIKTVETHLGHIYQKLDIRSRWQLIGRTVLDAITYQPAMNGSLPSIGHGEHLVHDSVFSTDNVRVDVFFTGIDLVRHAQSPC